MSARECLQTTPKLEYNDDTGAWGCSSPVVSLFAKGDYLYGSQGREVVDEERKERKK
jgi:hypothetical protein